MAFSRQAVQQVTGTPFVIDNQRNTTPGNLQTVISEIVAANTLSQITQIRGSLRFEAVFEVFIEGESKGVFRRGPGRGDAEIFFNPALEATSGELIEVKLNTRADAPIVPVATFVYGANSAV